MKHIQVEVTLSDKVQVNIVCDSACSYGNDVLVFCYPRNGEHYYVTIPCAKITNVFVSDLSLDTESWIHEAVKHAIELVGQS